MRAPSFTLAFIALASIATLVASCHIPDVSSIDLSGCMDDCNAISKSCLSATNETLVACDPADDPCRIGALEAAENCMTADLDCIDVCVAEVEAILKG